MVIGGIIGSIIGSIILGCATNIIIHNKGYDENWFWWGFFFGIIALIVAAAKPENQYDVYTEMELSKRAEEDNKKRLLQNGGWDCVCGRTNANYTGTCTCGRTKSESQNEKKKSEEAKKLIQSSDSKEHNLDDLKKLKELLDMGAITQEEFDQKKKQLLELQFKKFFRAGHRFPLFSFWCDSCVGDVRLSNN